MWDAVAKFAAALWETLRQGEVLMLVTVALLTVAVLAWLDSQRGIRRTNSSPPGKSLRGLWRRHHSNSPRSGAHA